MVADVAAQFHDFGQRFGILSVRSLYMYFSSSLFSSFEGTRFFFFILLYFRIVLLVWVMLCLVLWLRDDLVVTC